MRHGDESFVAIRRNAPCVCYHVRSILAKIMRQYCDNIATALRRHCDGVTTAPAYHGHKRPRQTDRSGSEPHRWLYGCFAHHHRDCVWRWDSRLDSRWDGSSLVSAGDARQVNDGAHLVGVSHDIVTGFYHRHWWRVVQSPRSRYCDTDKERRAYCGGCAIVISCESPLEKCG